MRLTLARKLFLVISVLLLAVLLGAFAVLERSQARQWRDYLNVQQIAFARFATPELLKHFRGNFSQAAGPAHREQLRGLLSFNPDLIKFTIYSPTGRELFDQPALNGQQVPAVSPDLQTVAAALDPVSRTLPAADGGNVLEVLAPAYGPSGQKVLYVRYLFSFQSVERSLLEMRRTFILIALMAGLSSLLLVALVTHRFTRPIHLLIGAVKSISSGQLQTKIPIRGTDELAVLAAAFNEMASSLSMNQEELQNKNTQLRKTNDELQQVQERLLRSERLAAVGQVAAGVSHEIDNPVGIILGYAELMLEDCASDDARAEDLKAIIAECHRCKKITGGLLGLARNGETKRRPVDIVLLLQETVKSLQPQKLFRQVSIKLPEPVSDSEVWADSDRLRQVFVNLLLNAAQALGGKGTVWIRVAVVDSSLHIEFHDDGPGIPQESRELLFEPFFTTKQASKGTGLGLSICRKVIEEHGGEIVAEQSQYGGAVFDISLPLRCRT